MPKRWVQCVMVGIGAVLACGALHGQARGATVSLVADRDNTLYEDSAGSLSNGAGRWLFSGVTLMESRRRSLLRFDVAGGLPAGAVVTDVQLRLTMDRGASSLLFMTLHRVVSDWGERSSVAAGQQGAGGAAQVGDATWLHRSFPGSGGVPAGVLWDQPGGDYVESPSAILGVAGNGAWTWSGSGLVNDVQSMLAEPEGNFGWLLLGDETSVPPTAKRFFSREAPSLELRPTLVVTYVPGPSGALVGVLSAGLINIRRRRRACRG